jgi:hypothetical protein
MATVTRMPIQVYLRPEQLQALRSLARRRNLAVAELIRRGVDRLLAEVPAEEDPLWDIVGLVQSGPSNLAEKHDEYVAEMIADENR